MRYRVGCILVCSVYLLVVSVSGQNNPLKPDQAKAKIVQIGVGNQATIRRSDGLVFSGKIVKADDDAVSVADTALKVTVQIYYNAIAEITAGASEHKTWNGKAQVDHTRRNLAIIFLIAGAAVPLIISLSRRHSNPPVFQ